MLIELGILKYQHLIIIVFPIIVQIQKYILTPKTITNIFYNAFCDYVGMVFCGLIHLIIKYYNKTDKQKENEEKKIKLELKIMESNTVNSFQSIELKDLMKKKMEKRRKILFIILMSAIQMSGYLIKNILSSKIHKDLTKNISNFSLALYLVIFSFIFLGFSIYIHQSFSFGIILLCSVIFITEIVIYGSIDFSDVIKSFFYFSLYEIFLCLFDVLGKKIS